MNASIPVTKTDMITSAGLAILATLFVTAVLRGREVPFIATDRAAFFVLAVIGFAMCSLAFPLRSSQPAWSWTNPLAVVAMTLGLLAVGLIILILLGKPPAFISSERQAFLTLAAIILAKFAVGHVRMWLA